MMVRLVCTFIIILVGKGFLHAQPSWIDPIERAQDYPESEYLLGFSSVYIATENEINQRKTECRQFARIDLIESLSISISITSSLSVENSSNQSVENFSLDAVTSSQLSAMGLITEDYFDPLSQTVYAIAYVKRKDLIKTYYKKMSHLIFQIRSIVQAESYYSNEIAYDSFMKASFMLSQSFEYAEVLENLGISDDLVLMRKERARYKVQLEEKINELKKKSSIDLDLGIRLLVDQLIHQVSAQDEVFVSSITYKNKGYSTEFSSFFDDAFRRYLITKTKISTRPVEKRVSGNYWLTENQIHIVINIHKYDGEEPYQLISGESLAIDRSLIDSLEIAYDYSNENSTIDLLSMARNNTHGGIFSMISTNKGTDGLYFKSGESLKLYLHVSKPAYIRLVNVWSDGSQLSLMENYFISESQSNQSIELPFEWETSCPCGLELIKLYASSSPFPPVEISSKDGLDYISGPISMTIQKSRSISEKNKGNKAYYYGESSLLVTTLESN